MTGDAARTCFVPLSELDKEDGLMKTYERPQSLMT